MLTKADPCALPRTPATPRPYASGRRVWNDDAWMSRRAERGTALDAPMAIYEVHAGSWRRNPIEGFGR